MEQTVVYTGRWLRRSDGTEVRTGESFKPNDNERRAFSDCLMSLTEAEEKGLHKGPATKKSGIASVEQQAAKAIKAEQEYLQRRYGKVPENGDIVEPKAAAPAAPAAGSAEGSDAGDDTKDGQPIDLQAMTVKQLQEFALANEIPVKGAGTKAEIIVAIEQHFNTNLAAQVAEPKK